jgi:hypothetical protein
MTDKSQAQTMQDEHDKIELEIEQLEAEMRSMMWGRVRSAGFSLGFIGIIIWVVSKEWSGEITIPLVMMIAAAGVLAYTIGRDLQLALRVRSTVKDSG